MGRICRLLRDHFRFHFRYTLTCIAGGMAEACYGIPKAIAEEGRKGCRGICFPYWIVSML